MGAREQREGLRKITQDTVLPISLIGAIAYIIFLVGSGYQQLNANTLTIGKILEDDKGSIVILRDICERLSRIEVKLSIFAEKGRE